MLNHEQDIVALVGAPNSGKTTLYNWLTNSKYKTVNYPGSTVDYAIGSAAARAKGDSSKDFWVVDTPGTYSLFPKSPDEEVTRRVLFEALPQGSVGKVILVCDGTQLDRHLLMAKQFKEAGLSFVMAVTMRDQLEKNKMVLNVKSFSEYVGAPVVLFDGVLGAGLIELVKALESIQPTSQKNSGLAQEWSQQQIAGAQEWGREATKRFLKSAHARTEAQIKSAKWDHFFLHPTWGLLIFLVVMSALFSSIFWAAAPLMDAVDAGFSWLGDAVKNHFQTNGQTNLVGEFLADGIISSFAAVFVFVPQIFILFLGIGWLESSGYLARAATLIDRPFSKLGLSGRSFVPLLSGFACAVPAMMAARNLSSSRDKWITNFIIPLLTCSARLPVYALLLSFLFFDQPAWVSGVVLAGLYLASLIVGAIAAAILNKILPPTKSSFLLMELPVYRRPRVRVLLSHAIQKTKNYVRRAGPVIFAFAVILWVGTHFPQAPEGIPPQQQLENSYLGKVGHWVEPVFSPMGVDWRVGVGLISAFAAREVFVSSLAVVFHVTGEEGNEDSQTQGLLKSMHEAKNSKGQLIFTTASVFGLIIFFMIALQCMSTVAVAVRETQSWKFAIGQLIIFNLIAYILAVAIFQTLKPGIS